LAAPQLGREAQLIMDALPRECLKKSAPDSVNSCTALAHPWPTQSLTAPKFIAPPGNRHARPGYHTGTVSEL
jgi:hypothetical protein